MESPTADITKNQEPSRNKADAYFDNGYHCAEAGATAVMEPLDEDPRQAASRATAFGGGFGRTFCGACVALSGALIVIGHLHGRPVPGGDWDRPDRAAETTAADRLDLNGRPIHKA